MTLFLAILSVALLQELEGRKPARDVLNQICAGARRRLLEEGTLPYVEEHFVLTALRALNQPNGRFSLVTVYEEYERLSRLFRMKVWMTRVVKKLLS